MSLLKEIREKSSKESRRFSKKVGFSGKLEKKIRTKRVKKMKGISSLKKAQMNGSD